MQPFASCRKFLHNTISTQLQDRFNIPSSESLTNRLLSVQSEISTISLHRFKHTLLKIGQIHAMHEGRLKIFSQPFGSILEIKIFFVNAQNHFTYSLYITQKYWHDFKLSLPMQKKSMHISFLTPIYLHDIS